MEVSGRNAWKGEDCHKSFLCHPCTIDSLHEDAIYYCINCNEFLCGNCTNNHRKSKASRNHTILEKDDMHLEKIETVSEQFCSKHNAEMINYFCSGHNWFCCSVCVTLDHMHCPVQYINKIAKSEEYKGLLQNINDMESQLMDHVTSSKQTKVKVGELFDQLQASLNLFRAEINVEIDALLQIIMNEAQQIKTDDLNSLEFKLTALETTLNDLLDVSSNLKKLEIYQQHRHLFISAKQAQTQVKGYKDEFDAISHQDIVIREYTFKPNEDIKTFLNSSKLGILETTKMVDGTIKEENQAEAVIIRQEYKMASKVKSPNLDAKVHSHTEPTTVYAGYVQDMEPHIETATKRESPDSKTAYLVKQINIQHRSDKALNRKEKTPCSITGIELLDSNTLVLADRENNCIKIVDLKTDNIVYCFKLDEQPHDLTSISQTRIVAACDTELVFLKFDAGKLSIEKRLPVSPGYRGIVYQKDKLFLTVAGKQPCVEVLDLEGNTLHVFAYDADGHKLFSDPRYIAVSTDGETMFISDRDMHLVKILDIKGNVISTYKHEGLKYPTGLIQDNNGDILVAGRTPNNIHRISQEGSAIQIELDNIEWPQAVAFSGMDNMLYITRCSSSVISVYNIESSLHLQQCFQKSSASGGSKSLCKGNYEVVWN